MVRHVYHHLTVGGTFDHFHKGHKALLDRAFEVGEKVYIGITTDEFVSQIQKRYTLHVTCYIDRRRDVESYLQTRGWLDKATIVPIDDRFGSTLVDEKLDAIVVSPETELVATEINLLRAQKDYSALEVILVPWVLAEDNKPIHSVRIRKGEIDREGKLYSLPDDWGVRKLPEELREELKIPMGRLISDIRNFQFPIFQPKADPPWEDNFQLISVGDAVTQSLLSQNIIPHISIVDLKIQRKQVYQNIAEIGFRGDFVHKKVNNPAGTLSYDAYQTLLSLIRDEAKPSVLQVEGEEDLLALLAVFCAPLGSLIVYGQPGEGVVVVEVSEENKQRVREMLLKFIV